MQYSLPLLFMSYYYSIDCYSLPLVFNGCDSSLWDHSYYPSKIFPHQYDNLDSSCMQIPTDGIGSMAMQDNDNKVIPTLWFDIGSEANIYYNISYDLRCNLSQANSQNYLYVMFRVEELYEFNTNNEYEFDEQQFGGYSLISRCGKNANKISIKKNPHLRTMDENSNWKQHQFNLNDGGIYHIKIVVGDELNHDPRYHKVYINDKLVLDFSDKEYLYGGVGLAALIGNGITDPTKQMSTFYIDDFRVNGMGFDEVSVDDSQSEENIDCEASGGIKHVNWAEMSLDASLKPNVTFEMNVDALALTLRIKLELDYIGYSYAGRLEEYGYGTSYVLDFESFDAHKSSISKPGTCSNRMKQSFANKNFADWWKYSLYPYLDNQIGQTDAFLSYPQPSEYWHMHMKNSQCTPIVYEGEFTLNDLRNCGDSDDESIKYLDFVNDAEFMNISGAFYVNLVSPMHKSIDIGYYYVYQLVSAPFVISIKKTINIMSSSGISLFTLTFVAVYKEEDASKYRLILLTESADYLFLNVNQLILAPNPSLKLANETNQCLGLTNNICSQLFEINAQPIDCANDLFSGQYGIRFDVGCNPYSELSHNECNQWLEDKMSDSVNNTIDLFMELEFEDTICDKQVYSIEFDAQMLFFIDEHFNHLQNAQYEIGVDRIYVSIALDFEVAAMEILETELINVWLCTIDQQNMENEEFTVSQYGDSGGCFATEIIDENQPYFIVQNGDVGMGYDALDVIIYSDEQSEFGSNEVRFSFIVPMDLARDSLFVHSQIKIQLSGNDEVDESRRLIDTDGNVQDQVRHFMQSTQLAISQTLEQSDDNQDGSVKFWPFAWLNEKMVIFFAALFGLIVAIGIILKCVWKKRRNEEIARKRRAAYIND